eukprot:15863-Karenia_brevis.AAC.1
MKQALAHECFFDLDEKWLSDFAKYLQIPGVDSSSLMTLCTCIIKHILPAIHDAQLLRILQKR